MLCTDIQEMINGLEAGFKGAKWLADGIGEDGYWKNGHYNNFQPNLLHPCCLANAYHC